jgi:hypothetical protein
MKKMQRRQFLAATATLGVSPWLLSACATSTDAAPTPGPSAATRRRLGPFEVFPIGLGCQWTRGREPGAVNDLYASTTDRGAAIALIRRAVDRGVTLIDTAEAYGPFFSEEVVGEALQGVRDRVVLCTKFGFDIDPQTGARRGGPNSRPETIRRVVDAQLRRLRTDRIDLLYQHRVDPQVPIEDVAGTIKDLVAQGMVRQYASTACPSLACRRSAARMPCTPWQRSRTSTRCCGAARKRKSFRFARSWASDSCAGARWAWGS